MEFRRYLYRRKANVTAQSILLAIGYNINKLHYKIQAGRTGRHLFPLKQTAWFWQVKSKSWKRTFFQKRFIKVRLLVETQWKERIFRLKNGKKMLPHLWFPNHWCDSFLKVLHKILLRADCVYDRHFLDCLNRSIHSQSNRQKHHQKDNSQLCPRNGPNISPVGTYHHIKEKLVAEQPQYCSNCLILEDTLMETVKKCFT